MAKNIREKIKRYIQKGLKLDQIIEILTDFDNYDKRYVIKSIKDYIAFENWYAEQLREQD